MHAVRNITLCTKDCLCLFVCPTGATDTETGQIDFARCLDGCRLCVDACPSHAIHLVFDRYPQRPEKGERVVKNLQELAQSKVDQETVCKTVQRSGGAQAKLARALALSNRILAEDCMREADFMLPQAPQVSTLLEILAEQRSRDFPEEALHALQQQFS